MADELTLGPERRLKRRGDYLRIQATGKKHHASFLMLAVSPKREEDLRFGNQWRIGITITKKVDKRAARRNRLRRRLKECFRLIRPKLQGQPMDLVLVAKSGACEKDFSQVRSEFRYLLKRAELLQESVARNRLGNKPARKQPMKQEPAAVAPTTAIGDRKGSNSESEDD